MEAIIFLVLFSLLGWVEVLFKPRLAVTDDYYIIWYGKEGRRNFVKFTKL